MFCWGKCQTFGSKMVTLHYLISKSLLLDYQNITKNFGISLDNMKSSKVKELIQETFGEERYHKNESIIVFKRNAVHLLNPLFTLGEYQKNKYYILQQKG